MLTSESYGDVRLLTLNNKEKILLEENINTLNNFEYFSGKESLIKNRNNILNNLKQIALIILTNKDNLSKKDIFDGVLFVRLMYFLEEFNDKTITTTITNIFHYISSIFDEIYDVLIDNRFFDIVIEYLKPDIDENINNGLFYHPGNKYLILFKDNDNNLRFLPKHQEIQDFFGFCNLFLKLVNNVLYENPDRIVYMIDNYKIDQIILDMSGFLELVPREMILIELYESITSSLFDFFSIIACIDMGKKQLINYITSSAKTKDVFVLRENNLCIFCCLKNGKLNFSDIIFNRDLIRKIIYNGIYLEIPYSIDILSEIMLLEDSKYEEEIDTIIKQIDYNIIIEKITDITKDEKTPLEDEKGKYICNLFSLLGNTIYKQMTISDHVIPKEFDLYKVWEYLKKQPIKFMGEFVFLLLMIWRFDNPTHLLTISVIDVGTEVFSAIQSLCEVKSYYKQLQEIALTTLTIVVDNLIKSQSELSFGGCIISFLDDLIEMDTSVSTSALGLKQKICNISDK